VEGKEKIRGKREKGYYSTIKKKIRLGGGWGESKKGYLILGHRKRKEIITVTKTKMGEEKKGCELSWGQKRCPAQLRKKKLGVKGKNQR